MIHALRRPARCLARVLSIVLFLVAPEVVAQQMVSVAGEKVNLRGGPGTQHAAEWILGHGYPLKIVGRHGAWLKVRDFENDGGWIYKALTSSTPYYIVKAAVANLRSRPSTHSRVLAKLAYGDTLKTLGRTKGWVHVQRDEGGTRGWVARQLLWGW